MEKQSPLWMHAIRLHAPGGPQNLRYEQVRVPEQKPGEVLVRVHAAAITRDELDWPTGRLPAIPSYEFSGVVAAVAPDVQEFRLGEAVYALSPFDRDGAAADYISVPGKILAPKPHRLGHIESAAIPLSALSAWQGLFIHGKLVAGQRVLILGAAGGVGSFAVQLARQRGAYVIGSTSTKNLDFVRKLGADEVIDNAATQLEEAIPPVDLVFDTAGGERQMQSLSLIRPNGRLVSIASEPPIDQAAGRGIQAEYFVVEPNRRQLVALAALIDKGNLQPIIDQVFPIVEAREAFERSLGFHGPGKIVLRILDE